MAVPTLDQVVARMKREAIDDVQGHRVPLDVKNFGELHDYVDGNCYGGFTDDDGIIDEMIALEGGRHPHNEGMPDNVVAFINDAQTAVSKWIEQGGLTSAIDNSDWTEHFTPYAFAEQIRRVKQLERHIDKMQYLARVFASNVGVVE